MMTTTIEMAREAAGDDWGLFQEFMPEIHRLVELVRADERARMATDKSKEAMKLALEALEVATTPFARDRQEVLRAQAALREALAEQPAQQEPVAAECNFVGTKEWGRCSIEHHNLVQSEPHKWPGYQTRLLYTSPPAQRTWVDLTEDEIKKEFHPLHATGLQFARAVLAKSKEKNA